MSGTGLRFLARRPAIFAPRSALPRVPRKDKEARAAGVRVSLRVGPSVGPGLGETYYCHTLEEGAVEARRVNADVVFVTADWPVDRLEEFARAVRAGRKWVNVYLLSRREGDVPVGFSARVKLPDGVEYLEFVVERLRKSCQ